MEKRHFGQFMDYARANPGETPVLTDLSGLPGNIASRQASIQPAGRQRYRARSMTCCAPGRRARVGNLLDNAAKIRSGRDQVAAGPALAKSTASTSATAAGHPGKRNRPPETPFTRLEAARTNATGTGLRTRHRGSHRAPARRSARFVAGPRGGLLVRLTLPIRALNGKTSIIR